MNHQPHQHEIPSREQLFQYIYAHQPVKLNQLIEELNIQEEQQVGIEKRLGAMLRDGQISQSKSKSYQCVQTSYLLTTTVNFDRDGTMLVDTANDNHLVYLPRRHTENLLSGDLVEVRISKPLRSSQRMRPKGKRHHWVASFIELKKRNISVFIAQTQSINQETWIIPIQKQLKHCRFKCTPNQEIEEGSFVEAQFTEFSNGDDKQPHAIITKVIGAYNHVDAMTEALHESYQFNEATDSSTSDDLKDIPDSFPREDMTDIPFYTIDGKDAKDLDDAIWIDERQDGPGWHVSVAIADVSHYVKQGTELDHMAYQKSTSVYMPHKVTHMLPSMLSEHLCSLNTTEKKRAMVVKMLLDGQGNQESFSFHSAWILSHARLNYSQVDKLLNDENASLEPTEIFESLMHLQRLTQKLLANRQQRGALEINAPYYTIDLDEQNRVLDLVAQNRSFSHQMIEEIMLLTNVTVATHLHQMKSPCIYRSHQEPKTDKIFQLRNQLEALNVTAFKGSKPTAKELNQIMQSNIDSPWIDIINDAVLKTQNQAIYTSQQGSHFGLGYDYYCHFTSPIRRYPDLMVHRYLKVIMGLEQVKLPTDEIIESDCRHFTIREKLADEAQRTAERWFKCSYMQDKIGEVYDGMIYRILPFGFFVRILDFSIDGLVLTSSIDDDYYRYDPKKQCLMGQNSHRHYRIGGQCRVMVSRVCMIEHQIDLELIES